MEYPHRKYLLYLLSRGMEPAEIRVDCLVKSLIPPDDLDISRLHHYDLGGALPTFWRAKITRENVKFRKWLRDRGVLPLWQRDAAMEGAFELLHRKAIRKDFETVILVHGDIAQARSELLVKYPEGMVPEEAVLMRFYDVFWNVGAMSHDGIMEYLTADEAREEYIPAVQGDLVKAYGQLGLHQRIRTDAFYQHVLEMATQQVLAARRSPNMSGQMKAGTAAMIKMGFEAARALDERNTLVEEGVGGLRDESADFVAAVVEERKLISIDELGDVIDAEEFAEAGNVHRLPVHRGS